MVIVWSARAERDLDGIAEFPEPLSPQAGARMLERIRKRVGDLTLFPESAHLSEVTGLRELSDLSRS
jgi:plasmid stabilization system protein ParE